MQGRVNSTPSSLVRRVGIPLYAGFCILLLFLVWLQIISTIRDDRENTIAAAIQRNSNLAVSLEQYALRTIKDADAALLLVSLEYERNGLEANLPTLLEKGIIDNNFFSGIVVFDADGRIRSSNLPGLDNQTDISDREHFRYHLRNSNQLFIGKPILSRTIREDVIVFSRPIHKGDGSFAGTVAIQMKPNRFTQFYSNANLRKHDLISLISDDGITYARRTGNIESYGEDISKSPLFGHVAKNPVGSYAAKDAIRGIPTYFSYRKLSDYPIIATVGASQADVLADHLKRRRIDLIYGLIISVVIICFFIFIYFLGQQRKNIRQKLWEEQKKHERELATQIIVAQEREREHIGHELHDNVNQVLTAVKLYLEMAVKKPANAATILPISIQHLTNSIHDLRNLSRTLSAPMLRSQTLTDSISSLIDMVSEPSGLQITFQIKGDEDVLSKDQKLTIYRILQEQLNNVVKHAKAGTVHIDVDIAQRVKVGISDDGIGFDVKSVKNGIGLNNISSRAEILGGRMIVSSQKGGGSVLTVEFPL